MHLLCRSCTEITHCPQGNSPAESILATAASHAAQGALPLELCSKVLSFLDIQDIAVCACVSRQWRKAAAEAVPLYVGSPFEGALSHLLAKPCALSSVRAVHMMSSDESHVQFMTGALFACICAEAMALEAVFIDDMRFAIMLPGNLKYLALSCGTTEGACPDLAPLSSLTQLAALNLSEFHRLTQPLPQLPSLLSLHVITDVLEDVSSVAMTLQELGWYAPLIDFSPPNNLAHFTRLDTLSVIACHSIRNFNPGVLPPSLGYINLTCGSPIDADQLTFPAGGHIVESCLGAAGDSVISWARL